MAPILPETGIPPSRRRTFNALCSPDELLGQIIQTLGPKYQIDAPYLLALRKALSSVIVAPKKPPRLIRTRPDKRIGQISSSYSMSQRSIQGPNGPPISTNASFYFHHEDPDFKRLLPQVDHSRYGRLDEQASEESQESTETTTLATPNSTLLRTAFSQSPVASAFCEKAALVKPTHGPSRTSQAPERVHSSSLVPSLPSAKDVVWKSPVSSLTHPQPTAIPTIVVSNADSENSCSKNSYKSTSASVSLLKATGIFVDLLDTQETNKTTPSLPLATSDSPGLPDTQDTTTSTQQSDVFSPPIDFLPCTPPTQEELQDELLSQPGAHDTLDLSATKKIEGNGHQKSLDQFDNSPESSLSHTPSLGKRPRETLERADDAPLGKRSKMPL
ncbi:hypothetical protein EKO04_004647 [Ascochyta lentis]|uniref:Uncharacterized protein n=1 Tax=Ascochyta lentis TaxID=205686 RepID=A0A8H7MJQ7_9PLEO|nr:hypothetical protein EKO04_004647 [Ascochyta lentis]